MTETTVQLRDNRYDARVAYNLERSALELAEAAGLSIYAADLSAPFVPLYRAWRGEPYGTAHAVLERQDSGALVLHVQAGLDTLSTAALIVRAATIKLVGEAHEEWDNFVSADSYTEEKPGQPPVKISTTTFLPIY